MTIRRVLYMLSMMFIALGFFGIGQAAQPASDAPIIARVGSGLYAVSPLRAYPNNGYSKEMTKPKPIPPKIKRERTRTPNNKTTTGFRVSDALWAVLEPLLPKRVNTHRFGGGRPRVSDRRCADAIFYVLRTGSHWEALNETELCAKSTAHDRFQEWVEADVFLKFWQAGLEQFDELKGIEWAWLSMDGAMTKAPLGGEKNGLEPDGPE